MFQMCRNQCFSTLVSVLNFILTPFLHEKFASAYPLAKIFFHCQKMNIIAFIYFITSSIVIHSIQKPIPLTVSLQTVQFLFESFMDAFGYAPKMLELFGSIRNTGLVNWQQFQFKWPQMGFMPYTSKDNAEYSFVFGV